ncbi:hypothetical protein INS49_005104 [Diaporthe citri]|uniref:uncharacterized protein n=1 Tax=Diaporthe citri TaxID=83186 RepID=UPI001C7E9350|nr:uncharacterized protein INS49_005104 [Diaporthe citri]KAG6354133.1 hypothetical protein INS49_005104 [Diaporthe citri]
MSTTKSTANRYNFLMVFLVTFGSLTYGYNSAIIGAVLGLDSFFKYFGIDLYGSNAAESSRITGATNGVFAAGGLLGCILMTWLGDAFGRKLAIQSLRGISWPKIDTKKVYKSCVICTACLVNKMIFWHDKNFIRSASNFSLSDERDGDKVG